MNRIFFIRWRWFAIDGRSEDEWRRQWSVRITRDVLRRRRLGWRA